MHLTPKIEPSQAERYRPWSLDLAPEDFQAAPHGFFLFTLGFFAVFHWFYALWYPTPAYPSTHLIGIAGLTLALFPLARTPLVILIGALVTDAVLQAPVFSNHTMLKNFLLLGMLAAAVDTAVRQASWAHFLGRVAMAGRWLLVGMYFYGVLHKINTGFLDPEVSCAGALWQMMPFPAFITHNLFIEITGIWATFIFEAAIVLLLLIRATRHLGIFFGISFHAVLALSGFEFYPTFSTLTIALHCLFLPPWAHLRMAEEPRVIHWLGRLRSPGGLAMIGIVLGVLVGYAWLGMLEAVALGWLALITPFAFLVLRFGREELDRPHVYPEDQRYKSGPVLPFRPYWVPVLVALYMFNGATPYLGLKTAQSFNMFANLRLEGGVSNHLVFPDPPGPFTYLEDLVEITGSQGVPYFVYIQSNDLRLVYYDFLNRLERAGPNARVSYRLNGEVHTDLTPEDLETEMDRLLHPRWFRAWFHFVPVDLTEPKPCAGDR